MSKYSLKNFAISEDIRKKIDFVFYNLLEREKPDSILLYGPPGCGKTELARSLAGELNFDIFELDSSVLSEYIGQAEKNIRKLFDNAREQGNCVIIIDEFEALAYKRENRIRSWEFSQTAEMLKQIENTMRHNKPILLIATTNYYEMIDTAMIRKGRFNNHIELSQPNKELRNKIFKIKLRNLTDYILEKNLVYDNFAANTEGLTGADIDDIVCNLIPHILFQKKKKTITNDIIIDAIKQHKNENKTKNNQTNYHQ